MKETIEMFEKRSFVNFCNGKIFVWKSHKKIGKPEKWDLDTGRRYLAWLRNGTL